MTLHFVIKSNFVALKIVIDYDDANIQSTVYLFEFQQRLNTIFMT